MSRCLCSHSEPDHYEGRPGWDRRRGPCTRPLCGCGSYRPAPTPGDEAEAWLAGREVPGKGAATGRAGTA